MEGSAGARSAWIEGALAEHGAALVRYASGITGDVESARDVVQETFARLCQADPARIDGHLREWLFTVCRNRALDARRRRSRQVRFRAQARESLRPQAPGSPADAAERRQALATVLAALERLPARQAELLRLRFRDGLRYREIAAATGLSISNVGYLIHVAMRTLREELS